MVIKSDQNVNLFNLIKSLSELEEPEEAEVCHQASICEYTSSKSIFNDSDEWPSQSANLFFCDMENQGNSLRGVEFNALFDSKRLSGLNDLQIDEMFFHCHMAIIHKNISQKNYQNLKSDLS